MSTPTDTPNTTNGPHYPQGDHGMWCGTCNFTKGQAQVAQAEGRITVTYEAVTMQSYSPRRQWRTMDYRCVGPDGTRFQNSRKDGITAALKAHYGRQVVLHFVNQAEAR
jgi:hypothetical protein